MKLTQASLSLIHQREDRRSKKKHSLTAAKTKTILQKGGHDEKESYVPFGSAGKAPAHSVGDLCSIPGLGRSPGEGKGYLLKYSVLENSMDGRVHGFAKSWTELSNFHMPQMNGQDKIPEKQLNEVEIGTLPEKDFRIMIVKMTQDLGKRMESKTVKMKKKMFTKDLEELKNKQMTNTLKEINSRITGR